MVVASLPVQFSVPPKTCVALFVDQVDTGPHRVAPQIPVFFFVVDENRKLEAFLLGIVLDILHAMFVRQLGGVDTDNREVFVCEFFVPILVPRIISNAIDSGKRVKMQRDHFAFEFVQRERWRINPLTGIVKVRHFHFDPTELIRFQRLAQQRSELILLFVG